MENLEKCGDGVYKSASGYYILNKQDNQYRFLPNEKEFDSQQLLDQINTLNILNEKKMMSYKEFIKLVDETYQQFNWRYGQTVMNVLHGVWPLKYNQLVSTSKDCYYDDSITTITLNILKNGWSDEKIY